jgi:hypothetical protein
VIDPVVDASTGKELSDAGIITKNEARKVLNFDPVPGGDRLAVRIGNQYLVLDDMGMPNGMSDTNTSDASSTVDKDKNSVDEQTIEDAETKKKKKVV